MFARQLLLDTAEVVLTAAKPKATNQLLRLVSPEPVCESVTQYPLEIESGVPAKPSHVSLWSVFNPNKKKVVVEQPVDAENEEVLSENDHTGLLQRSFCCV